MLELYPGLRQGMGEVFTRLDESGAARRDCHQPVMPES